MKKMHHHKTYTLATEIHYDQPQPNHNHNPFRVSESDCTTPNIFQTKHLQKLKFIQLNNQRLYEYVGVKDLKNYQERIKRNLKDKKRETNSALFIIPRQSGAMSEQNQDDHLTKQQLHSKISKIQALALGLDQQTHPQPHGNQIKIKISPLNRLTIESDSIIQGSLQSRKKIKPLDNTATNSSILKIKTKLNQYNKVWSGKAKNGNNRNKKTLKLNGSKTQLKKMNSSIQQNLIKNTQPNEKENGFRTQNRSQDQQMLLNHSILDSLPLSYDKKILKQLSSLDFQQQNIPPSRWQQILRKQEQLTDLYEKARTKIEKRQPQLNLAGKNKIKEEIRWLKQKEENGYYFRSCTTNTENKRSASNTKHSDSHHDGLSTKLQKTSLFS